MVGGEIRDPRTGPSQLVERLETGDDYETRSNGTRSIGRERELENRGGYQKRKKKEKKLKKKDGKKLKRERKQSSGYSATVTVQCIIKVNPKSHCCLCLNHETLTHTSHTRLSHTHNSLSLSSLLVTCQDRSSSGKTLWTHQLERCQADPSRPGCGDKQISDFDQIRPADDRSTH